MGFSIGKVFKPIENALKDYGDVSYIELPCGNYSVSSLCKNIAALKQHLRVNRYDIVHITGAEHYLLPFIRKENTICTVHDLGFYTQQTNILKKIKKRLLWINTLKYADALTFISEKSKNEALSLVDLNPSKCYVVHNPVDSSYRFSKKVFNKANPVILHIGTKSNKNLERIAEALKGMDITMRIVGKLNDTQIAALNANGIHFTNVFNLSDEQIKEEYENCDIVSFPSLYEGFGMPIIEGNAIGRVVVTSNLSPMKEIAGGAAILVNPLDVKSIRNGFKKAIMEGETFIEKGLRNAERFDLKAIFEQYIEIYNKVLLNK